MKKISILMTMILCLEWCTSLTRTEYNQLQELKSAGITIDTPIGEFENPASPTGAALLNLLPGIGNFYLATGRGSDSSHALYGTLNLLLWPISVVWGVPEAAIDAQNINKRELLYYYQYDPQGKKALKKAGFSFNE